MPIERIVAVALIIVSGLLLGRFAPGAIRSWQIYAGTGRRRQQDAAGRAPAPPPGILDRLALLGESGYRHIGETRLELPVGERFAWIAAADDGDSYAILAGATGTVPLTGLYSAWVDGTWLGTIHPLGSAMDRGGLQVRIVTTTLSDAVAVHREGVARLRASHGDPRPVRSIADMLALDADYRVRFGGSRLRPLTARTLFPAVLSACVLALAIILLAVSFRTGI
ncbi:MAG: hypothetical protein QOE66_674 [Chloroflexota bacterium]|jgi:hypothetical protein|nr:hypothetical protein [Chloroflexota bacterium]